MVTHYITEGKSPLCEGNITDAVHSPNPSCSECKKLMAMSGADLAQAYADLLTKRSHYRYDTSGQHGMNIYQDTYHFVANFTVLVSAAFEQLVADPESAPLLAVAGRDETLRDCAKIWLESNKG